MAVLIRTAGVIPQFCLSKMLQMARVQNFSRASRYSSSFLLKLNQITRRHGKFALIGLFTHRAVSQASKCNLPSIVDRTLTSRKSQIAIFWSNQFSLSCSCHLRHLTKQSLPPGTRLMFAAVSVRHTHHVALSPTLRKTP
jgi:hypothetical protein